MPHVLFSGRSNPPLAEKVASALGGELGRCLIEDYPDGEIRVQLEEEVQGREVYLLQSTGAPVGSHLLELLLLADACRRQGAAEITAILPYFGYARQDRRTDGAEPVGARVVADILGTRFDRIVAVDLHNPAIEGFFDFPLVHLSAVPLLAEAFFAFRSERNVVVAPDAGAVKLANRYAEILGLPVACLQKVRHSGEEVSISAVSGDVRGLTPVIVDDMISTGGTMAKAVEALLEKGANDEMTLVASHGLLVGDAVGQLKSLPIRRLIVTDSVPPRPDLPLPLEVVSLGGILADTIRGGGPNPPKIKIHP